MQENYVQTKIQSGAGGEEWGINHLGMGLETPYNLYGLSLPSTYNIYACTFSNRTPSECKIILRGNVSKTVKLISCRLSVSNEINQVPPGIDGSLVIRKGTISNIGSWTNNGVKVSLDSSQPAATTEVHAAKSTVYIPTSTLFNMYVSRNAAGFTGLVFFQGGDFIYTTEMRGKYISIGNDPSKGVMLSHEASDGFLGFIEMAVTWIEY